MMIITMKGSLLILFLVLVGSSTVRAARPPFVQHVSKETLQEALRVGNQQHLQAIRLALNNYPVDDVDARSAITSKVPMKEYKINAEGSLPDFVDELPTIIYVTDPPLLSKEECNHVVQSAEEYFAKHHDGEWTRQKSGQYEVLGFYIKQVPAVHEWFLKTLKTKLFPVLSQTFPNFCESPDDLVVDNAYLFKYTPETGRRTDVHTDSGCLSFTIALNGNDEYDGGGTWFQGLESENSVIEMDQGQVTFRAGGVKHCGHAVTRGTRYIIGGFCMNRKKPEYVRQILSGCSDNTNLLEAAVALNPQCDSPYNLLAHRYEEMGRVDKAQQVLEYCLNNVHSTSGEVAYALGSIYVDQKAFDKARACMEICLSVDDADVDAMMGMARCAAALGDAKEEEMYYRRIIDTPGADTKVLAQAYCNLGVLYEGADEEIACFLSSLELNPDSFAARYSLGSSYAQRKQWDLAVEAFKIAVKQVKEDDPDQKIGALQSLYTSTMHLLQSRQASGGAPSTREEMVQRFQEIMGPENYAALIELKQRS